ncbi:MAG: hypothetical protein EOO53_21235 [Gammaproteobacteria bacterium]|nr:MAG: hypothetical protein EOO53_21235 [Gammaproteobacteria bacterium]
MTQSSKQYQLEKSLWTEEDFDTMGWHDSLVYGISFGENFQLLFDIDYIFKWVLTGKTYHFWVSPCTLVFENVYDLKFDLEFSGIELEIDDVTRDNPQRPKNADFIGRDVEMDWVIETQQGTISFKSIGYKQYVRQLPRYLPTQAIERIERGGISFETKSVELDNAANISFKK